MEQIFFYSIDNIRQCGIIEIFKGETMEKNCFIHDLKEGDRVDDIFQVKSVRLAETRAGKPYLILVVADRSGEIGAPVWDDAEKAAAVCESGAFVNLTGAVQSYREKPQLKVDALRRVEKERVDLADFVVAAPRDIDAMAEELQLLVNSVKNPHIKKLLRKFFAKGAFWERFQRAPAAKGIHLAYLGGLLELSLSVARLADCMASHYPGVDRSLLIAGSLLHDIGKLEELKTETGVVEYTDSGSLRGQLVIGSEMVSRAADTIKDFPGELLTQIQHLILSHHGRQEFGSPIVPMTVEAYLLSQIDDMDAKMNLIEHLRRRQKEEGMLWSEYQRSLERFLYLSPLERTAPPDETETVKPRQLSLF